MGLAGRQLNKLGRQSMLGVRESGKLMSITPESCKTFIGRLVQSVVTGMKINSVISLKKAKKNLEQLIHSRSFLQALKQTAKVSILACFLLIAHSFVVGNLSLVYASEVARNSSIQIVNIDVLADAIYRAEGGAKTRHPYGIIKKYKTTTPRQACINTIKSNIKRYKASGSTEPFIEFMARSYCPIGANNDPTGLNVHWVKNVSFFYAKFIKKNLPKSPRSVSGVSGVGKKLIKTTLNRNYKL